MNKPIVIGVCFSETKYPNYPAWMMGEDHQAIEVVELFWDQKNLDDLYRCQGLLLTGGVDIDPYFFEPVNPAIYKQPNEWNRTRDQFELDLFKVAQSLRMPVLGVCRGLQLINVSLGGTLIADLEESGKSPHRNLDGTDYIHPVLLSQDSLLSEVTGIASGNVNSAHHQAIDQLAESLEVGCYSGDGIIEGIEWKEKSNRSPLIAVQWHPERIENKEINPLSQNIKEWFFEEASKFKR